MFVKLIFPVWSIVSKISGYRFKRKLYNISKNDKDKASDIIYTLCDRYNSNVRIICENLKEEMDIAEEEIVDVCSKTDHPFRRICRVIYIDARCLKNSIKLMTPLLFYK